MIEIKKDGNYFTFTNRGTDYLLRFFNGEWEMSSFRKALGRSNRGSVRFFKTLEDIGKKVKSLKILSKLIDDPNNPKPPGLLDGLEVFKMNVDGMLMGIPIPMAEKKMKDVDGGVCHITATNGQMVFIKKDGVVRDSTNEEWEEYFIGLGYHK